MKDPGNLTKLPLFPVMQDTAGFRLRGVGVPGTVGGTPCALLPLPGARFACEGLSALVLPRLWQISRSCVSQFCAEPRHNGGRCYFGITGIWSAFFGQILQAAMFAERVTFPNLSLFAQKTTSGTQIAAQPAENGQWWTLWVRLTELTRMASEPCNGRCLCMANRPRSFFFQWEKQKQRLIWKVWRGSEALEG